MTMNRIRREVLNGLFVLVLSTMLSAAIAAFQIRFDLKLWVLIFIGVAVAAADMVVFELALGYMASTEVREQAAEESTRRREEEWLKRVGNPGHFEYLGEMGERGSIVLDAVNAIKPGSDLTFLNYIGSEGGGERFTTEEVRKMLFEGIIEQLKRGTIREYKRIFCFDHEVLANNPELKSGILRVGDGAGTIARQVGEHCRQMMETKGCSLYVAPVLLRHIVGFYGTDKVSMTVETVDQQTGLRKWAGLMFFHDPPNGEMIEQFRQIERATERRMAAVHKIVFPEDESSRAQVART